MAAGLIAGAIQGLGGAMQHNAQGQIEEKRQKALMSLEQEMALEQEEVRHNNTLERDEVGHGYSMDQLEQGHEYGLEELGARHGYSMEQERFRQGQQNYRTRAGAGQIVPLEGGGYGRYNPIDNSLTALPEGIDPGGLDGGDLTDRQRARIEMLGDRANALREKQAEGIEPLTAEEKANLGRIEAEMDSLLGGRSGPTPLEQLMAGEEGAGGDQDGGQGGGEPPPTQGSVDGIIQRRQQEAADQQAAQAGRREVDSALDSADDLVQRANVQRYGGNSPMRQDIVMRRNGGMGEVDSATLEEAQEVAAQLRALESDQNLSAKQKEWVADSLLAMERAGLPINTQ